MATKKVGSTGRFGPRYGLSVKRKVRKVERTKKTNKTCPECKRPSLKRISVGVFECKKCRIKTTGRAYTIQ